MGSGPSRSSSESHLSENGGNNSARQRVNSVKNRTQGTENSKKDEPVVGQAQAKLTTQSTLSKKESPFLQRSDNVHSDDFSPQLQAANATEQQEISPNRLKKFTLSSGMSLSANAQQAGSEVLVKMGSKMLRTKNCSEEFQSLDLGEPIVLGKFDHDKNRNLHPLALERYCLVESSSVCGFSMTLNSNSETNAAKNIPEPIAQHSDANGSLYRLCDNLPLYWLHASTAADMRSGADQLKEEGYDSATVFMCAADPVIFARSYEDRKGVDPAAPPPKKNVFFCLPALVRAAPPSRRLYVAGRQRCWQLERDIKMSIIHLVAQDVNSSGAFPAYFGLSSTTSQDATMSIGWTQGRITAAHADDINTSTGAATEEFELLRPRIHRIQTAASTSTDVTCLDESEINTISQAILTNYYEKLSQSIVVDQVAQENTPVFEESNFNGPKIAVVITTFEDLSVDTSYILLLSAIALTLQQESCPILYRKLFEEVPPQRLSEVIKNFANPDNQIAARFDEFVTQICARLFKGSTSAALHFVSTNRNHIIRYAYLFLYSYYCFNIYVKKSSSSSFSKWLRRNYLCYRSLAALSAPVAEIVEITTTLQQPIFLVSESDDVPMMSIVSSDFGVKARGFRKIPPAPVYGAQSPSANELTAIVDYCAVVGRRWRHTAVVWVDLRTNPVVYVDGKPHVLSNTKGVSLSEHKIAIDGGEIEQVEEYFKQQLSKSALLPQFAKKHSGTLTPIEKKEPPKVFMTPREIANNLHLLPRTASVESSSPKIDQPQPNIVYYRLPVYDEKAPFEQVLQELVSIVLSQNSIYVDEDGPAFLFTCASGVGAVTVMMIAATLISYHLNGFPYGCHVGEEERVSIKNVQYTKGNFQAVRELVELMPRGNQVKREVDAVLDACWDRMTSTFYHLREIIFATFSKVFTISDELAANNSDQAVDKLYRQSVDYLERYVLLILFNAYLHAKKHEKGGWQNNAFQDWLSELAASDSPLIATLDNLCFQEFGDEHFAEKCSQIKQRWLSGTCLQKLLDD